MATTTRPAATSANFDRLTKSSYAQSMCEFGRLHFRDNGKIRLAHTIGLLEGIHRNEPEKAYALADSLCKYLDYLLTYGGTMESPEGNAISFEFPTYRVVLGDDGGIGSFSIGWFRAVPHKAMMDLAETFANSIAAELHGKTYADLTRDDDRDKIWQEALLQSRQKFKINEELTEERGYFPKWDTDRKYYSREYVYYGYCHNGGLIYHHDRDDITNGSWSTHT